MRHYVALLLLVGGCIVTTPPPPREATSPPGATILVQAASYGANCGVPTNNVIARVAAECDGKRECSFRANNNLFGDPAVNCPKDFVAEWKCADRIYRTRPVDVRPGENNPVTLACR